MTATKTFKPAKDGTGAAFNLEMATESVSGNTGQATYLASPSTEALVEPMQQTGGSVALVASVAAIGSVIGRSSNPAVTPTITAGAYTAGQEVGGLMTFPVGGAGSGILESIWITCKSVQTTALKLYIFDVFPGSTTWTNHSTPAINVLDDNMLRGVFSIPSPDSGLGTHTIWNIEGLGASFVGANLYGILVVVGTPTFTSTTDITVQLGIVDD